MEKTRCRDLMVINHRLQGLAEKICKTHKIVLAKRLKDRGKQVKESRWDLCAKGRIILDGYGQTLQDTSYRALFGGTLGI
jgi:hypothetical protein